MKDMLPDPVEELSFPQPRIPRDPHQFLKELEITHSGWKPLVFEMEIPRSEITLAFRLLLAGGFRDRKELPLESEGVPALAKVGRQMKSMPPLAAFGTLHFFSGKFDVLQEFPFL